MYPAGKVSEEVVHRIVSSLGPGKHKATSTTQQALLKWILLVFDVLESLNALLRLYSVLFNLLDVLYLRARLCHLLAKITQEKHLKQYRIEALKTLEKGVTADPHLIKLISVFESLSPGTFDIRLRKGAISFPDLDRQWIKRLSKIQSHNLAAFPIAAFEENIIGLDPCPTRKVQNPHLRNRSSAVDNVGTLSNIVDTLEDLEISHLSLSELQRPLILSYLTLRPERANSDQAEELFKHYVGQQNEDSEEDGGLRQDILDGLSLYVGRFKVLSIVYPWCRPDQRLMGDIDAPSSCSRFL